MASKRVKRGQFVRLPNGAGQVAVTRDGAILFKPAAPAKKKNPARPRRKPPKAKQPAARVLRSMATWVKAVNAAGRKTNGRRPARKTARRKGGAR